MPISIIGGDALRERLAGLYAGLLDAAQDGMADGLQIMKADAVKNCPVDTGYLRGSIQAKADIVDDTVEGKLYSPLGYAVYVEMGTGPKGEASHASAAPVGATYRTTGWVYHDEHGFHYTTGQPARSFLYPAYLKNKQLVLGKITEAVRKKVRGE